mgnify:FL=1
MIKKYTVVIFYFCLFTFGLFAQQPTQEWVSRFTNGSYASGQSVQLDSAGNAYVLVSTTIADSTQGDYCVLKYTSGGTLLWTSYYNSPGNLTDDPKAFVVSGSGDIFVTGQTRINFNSYIATVKFNSSGVLQWAKTFDSGFLSSDAVDIALDSEGNIAICGGTKVTSSLSVGFVIKYNSSGDSLWAKRYNPAQKHNFFAKLAIDNQDNIVVTGYYDFDSNVDYLIVKYLPDGTLAWDVTYDSPQNYDDGAMFLAIDTNRNIYTVGTSAVPAHTANNILVKLNSSGAIQWAKIFTGILSGEGRCQYPGGIVTTPDGNSIYYTTFCANGTGGGGYDIVTLKYNSIGDTQWVKRYWGGVPGTINEPSCIKLDKHYNIYVTGAANYNNANTNITTIRYLPNGTQQWVTTYNGPLTNSFDYSHDLKIDSNLKIFVTGISSRFNGNPILWDAVTIKYSQPIGIIGELGEIPNKYFLYQNYPNPFNSTTVITYALPEKAFINLNICDITGRLIKKLVNNEQGSGYYSLAVNLEDVSSGMYFYTLLSNNKILNTRKLILVK